MDKLKETFNKLSNLKLIESLNSKSKKELMSDSQNADILPAICENPEFNKLLNSIAKLKSKEEKIIIISNRKVFTYQGVFNNKVEFDCILNNSEKDNQTIQNLIICPTKSHYDGDLESKEPNFFNSDEIRFIAYPVEKNQNESAENEYITIVSHLKDNEIKNSYYSEDGSWLATDYIKHLRLTHRYMHNIIFSDSEETNNEEYCVSNKSLPTFISQENNFECFRTCETNLHNCIICRFDTSKQLINPYVLKDRDTNFYKIIMNKQGSEANLSDIQKHLNIVLNKNEILENS